MIARLNDNTSADGYLPKSHSHLRNISRWLFAVALCSFLAAAFSPSKSLAQGTLTNGYTHEAVISPVGDTDVWTFSATIGDRIVIRVGEISQTNTLNLRITLQNPSAVIIASTSHATAAEIAITATNTGVFTLNVDDVGSDATGMYRLTLAKMPGAITVSPGDEGGPLTNGVMHTGLLPMGDLDMWDFTASSGDRIVVRAGDVSNTSSFGPEIRVYGPNGTLLGTDSGDVSEVAVTATNSGTFTVVLGNSLGATGAGTYRLTLAKSPGANTVSPGDEGGPVTNGVMHTGALPWGDLDVWDFTANSGDRIVVRAGDVSNTSSFGPEIRVYGPNGTLLGTDSGDVSEVAVTATNSGTFTVVLGNSLNGTGTGTYRLTLAKMPGAITVSPGDEGGPLTSGIIYTGTNAIGDLDVWTFNACEGDAITLQMTELTGASGFTPAMRLYAPNGMLLRTASGSTSALISTNAPFPGSYTLVVGDNGDGAGTYQLIGTGISTGFVMCRPLINGTNLIIRSVGGPAGSNYVLFATTNITLPLANWTPIRTNQFGTFGEFSVTNGFNPVTTQQFFRVRSP